MCCPSNAAETGLVTDRKGSKSGARLPGPNFVTLWLPEFYPQILAASKATPSGPVRPNVPRVSHPRHATWSHRLLPS
jgi:hypothetical protein